jgi:hypothetical protein
MLFILLSKDAAFPHVSKLGESQQCSLGYARAFLGPSGGWDMSPKIQNQLHIVYLVLWVLCLKVETAEDRDVSGDEQGVCSMSIFSYLSLSIFPSRWVPYLLRSRMRIYADVVRHFVNVLASMGLIHHMWNKNDALDAQSKFVPWDMQRPLLTSARFRWDCAPAYRE